MAVFAVSPYMCVLLPAFPKSSSIYFRKTDLTVGSIGVVAQQSKYTGMSIVSFPNVYVLILAYFACVCCIL
jgi:hypothetical protein